MLLIVDSAAPPSRNPGSFWSISTARRADAAAERAASAADCGGSDPPWPACPRGIQTKRVLHREHLDPEPCWFP
eukprot:7404044-Pyramimonas_sp.AAC.1